MGIWDFFKQDKGSPQTRTVRRYVGKLTNKWIDESERYNAIDRLLELSVAEAYDAVLKRFTFLIDNSIKDNEEKQYLYERIQEKGREMVDPLRRHLQKEDEISWPLRALGHLVGEKELAAIVLQLLAELDPIYSRHNDKKVILLDYLKEHPNDNVFKGVEPFLEDTDDDVRIKAIETLAQENNQELLRERIIKMLLEEAGRPRIQRKAAEELARLGWDVKGYFDLVKKVLPEGFFLDRKNHIKIRTEGV